MEEYKKYYSAITKIAWGYIFIYVNINISTIDILPSFAGYAMMLYSLSLLKDKCKNIMLLRPLAILLIVWNVISWVMTAAAVEYSIAYVSLIMYIAELYFHFQLLTDLSQLAAEYQGENQHTDKALILRRNIYTGVSTLFYLLTVLTRFVSAISQLEAVTYIMLGLSIVMLFVAIMIIFTLFSLRKLFKTVPYIPSAEEEEEEEEEEYTESNENAETDEEKEAPSQEDSE